MNNLGESHNLKQSKKKWKKVNVWSIKGPILVIALFLGFFGDVLHLGRASLAAGVAMTIPIIGFRDFWKDVKFWITVVLLGLAQVPLVIGVRPLMEQFKFPLMLAFGIADCGLVILAIFLACSRSDHTE